MPRHKTTKAELERSARYQKKQDQIMIRSPKENDLKNKIQERAAALGISVNAYIIGLINADLQNAGE